MPYDALWPERFRQEEQHLRTVLPHELVGREHYGSTAVPGLPAKPIVDMLIEVTDLEATRARIAPILEAKGYDYFWRPSSGMMCRHGMPGSLGGTSPAVRARIICT